MIIRSARPHLNYSVVHNDLIKDKRISFKARVRTNRERIRRMEEGEL